jgi:hypothetical protein
VNDDRFWVEVATAVGEFRLIVSEVRPLLHAMQADSDAADERIVALVKAQDRSSTRIAMALREGLAEVAEAQRQAGQAIVQAISRMVVEV